MRKAFRNSITRRSPPGTSNHGNEVFSKHKSDHEVSMLWYSLSKKYQYRYPKDWYLRESHWLNQIESFQEQPVDCPGRDARTNNSLTRISQCNESFQLSDSLPISFFVPKDLDDVTLIHKMSTNIRDHRVPIISYCCPIEYRRNFIIRCASFDYQSDISKILTKIVKPSRMMDITVLAPSLNSVEIAHRKLRNVCRPGIEPGSKFISKSGKWLSIVSQTIKLAKTTARTVLTEASVLLIENEDRHWNCVISSLAQILLDPHTRTIDGFESLISKEWIYLCGHNYKGLHHCNSVSTLFILFLDCVCQMYSQNPYRFEFTSEYLRYLYDAQFIPTKFISNQKQKSQTQIYQNINNNTISRVEFSKWKNGTLNDSYTDNNHRSNNYEMTNMDGEQHQSLDSILSTSTYKKSLSSLSHNQISLNHEQILENELHQINLQCKNPSTSEAHSMMRNASSSAITNNINSSNSSLESGYTLNMFNPFYDRTSSSIVMEVNDHIASISLWSSLYLRWQSSYAYSCPEEYIYLSKYLSNSNIIYSSPSDTQTINSNSSNNK